MADSLYESGQVVQITNGEFEGRIAKVGQSASVNGAFQYGLEGISETEGHLYAVHEHEITDKIDERANVVVEEPQPIVTSTTSSTSTNFPSEELDNVSSLLQKASQVAQGREVEFAETLQNILARLDRIDIRLETKEIKVVVEVQHIYPEKPDTEKAGRVTGGYFTSETGKVKWHNDMPATYSDEDRLEERDEDVAQLDMDLFAKGEEE